MPKVSYTLPIAKQKPQEDYEKYYDKIEKKMNVEEQYYPAKPQEQRIYSRRTSKSQNHSEPEKGNKKEEKGNLFRGLGYNVITNHKFSYDMMNNYKNETSPWLKKQ